MNVTARRLRQADHKIISLLYVYLLKLIKNTKINQNESQSQLFQFDVVTDCPIKPDSIELQQNDKDQWLGRCG